MTIPIIKKIAEQLELGREIKSSERLYGGLMHKMYFLSTEKGEYVVKLLNPHIMKRKTALQNFTAAELLEEKLEKNSLPIVSSIKFNDKKRQNILGQYFYIYEFYDGQSLKTQEITEDHCIKIGKALAEIHKIEKHSEQFVRSKININWDDYINQMSLKNKNIYNLLKQNRALLYKRQEKGNEAIDKLPSIVTICHNDLDSKNVLWNDDDYRIIDLETLSYSNPFLEIYEVALRWSGYEEGHINYDLFNQLIESYVSSGGELPTDWTVIYDSNYDILEWLEYNLKRSLGIDCDIEETEIGILESVKAIQQIIYYEKIKNELLKQLEKQIAN